MRLPRLAVCCERPASRPSRADRDFFGLTREAHLYVCPQTLFKFHPEFDALLGASLRADPHGLLVLIEGAFPDWTDLLRRRFATTLGDVQAHIRFLPPQPRDRFLDLLAVADVMLDPIHFGGGNTSYEVIAQGVPIVALPSSFLRGRLTYALYRQMGLLDLMAEDAAGYARLAVALGTDALPRVDAPPHPRGQLRPVGRRGREPRPRGILPGGRGASTPDLTPGAVPIGSPGPGTSRPSAQDRHHARHRPAVGRPPPEITIRHAHHQVGPCGIQGCQTGSPLPGPAAVQRIDSE